MVWRVLPWWLMASLLLCALLVGLAPQPAAAKKESALAHHTLAAPAPLAGVDTLQNFDQLGLGAPYAISLYYAANPRPPARLPGGPTQQGSFLRLAFADPPTVTHAGIIFDRTAADAFDVIVADFDLRITPGLGRADGIGFALLNTAVPTYGVSGPVDLLYPFAAEEPNFVASLGIGFDVYQSTLDQHSEPNNNHLSVHFNGALLQEFDATPAVDLANGQWIHARILMRPGGGHSDVTVMLATCGAASVTLVNQFPVAGFTPYPGRVHLAARSGGETADQDIDNLHVQFLTQVENIPPLQTNCAQVVENDFNTPGAGTLYTVGSHYAPNPRLPERMDGGPTGEGQLLRLAFATPATTSHTSIDFVALEANPLDRMVADFDLRMTPGSGRADGVGFALLNTAEYGITGVVALPSVAEEPNFAKSLGIGFDIYRSTAPTIEINHNHLSLHYDGQLVQEFDAFPALDLAGGQWVHARVILEPTSTSATVTVELTQCGRPPIKLIDRFPISGFTPYRGRVHFAGRVGGLSADHDLDNVRVHFLASEQNLVAFETGCAQALESGGAARASLTRLGDTQAALTLGYLVSGQSAQPEADYTTTKGTLTFAAGETTKTFTITLLDDGLSEGDESFLITLRPAEQGGLIGGPHAQRTTIVDDETASLVGHWSEVIPAQVLPIHLHLLPTGKVMYWDRHDENRHNPNAPLASRLSWDGNPRLWDPLTGIITRTATVTYDLFCAGHSFLADGRLLVTGGHVMGTTGEDKASLYDPFTDAWARLPNMNKGRWYPSNVTLATGDVLVVAGTHASGLNTIPQIWQTSSNSWRTLTGARQGGEPGYADYYPYLYAAPNGQVFNAGPQQMARYLDPTDLGKWRDVAPSALLYRDYGSSVLYADGKVLLVGGNPRGETNPPSATAQVIDLNVAQPQWRGVESMHFGRRHLNATLLPDGTVLVTGGSRAAGFDNPVGKVLQAELWNPVTERWSTLAAQARYRGYHSTALLLPDGRVLTGGGGHPNPAGGSAEYNFEIYSPPYLFKGSRPTIVHAPQQVGYRQFFSVQTPDAAVIRAVNWIRLSSVTHAFNQNQRINHLTFAAAGEHLVINTPLDPNLAPPGHYLLFLLNEQGVPSLAHIIQLVEGGPWNYVHLPLINR
jgi:hypothetical protein